MLDKDSGVLHFPKLIRIGPHLKREEFLAGCSEQAKIYVQNEPWCSYVIQVHSPGETWSVVLFFHDSQLQKISLSLLEGKEQMKKAMHDAWLRSMLGSNPPYVFPWGTIMSVYDSRSLSSHILISYQEQQAVLVAATPISAELEEEEEEEQEELFPVQVPLNPANAGGPSCWGECSVAMRKGSRAIVHIENAGEQDWLEEGEYALGEFSKDQKSIRVIRKATEEDLKQFRVPLWIQDGDVPECCGLPMFFVGQLDDDTLYQEKPADSEMWWHDRASFYVFTCSRCLGVKAVGQQF